MYSLGLSMCMGWLSKDQTMIYTLGKKMTIKDDPYNTTINILNHKD